MFLGHFAAGLAAKRLAPRTSLGTLLAAAQLIDLVWPALVLAGVERVRIAPGDTAFTPLAFEHYPWTHSLLMACAWAAGFAVLYRARTGSSRGAAVVGGLVVSHWVLDLVAHRPDLPLAPGAAMVGLGLWNSVAGTLVVEGALFAGGVLLYATGTRARNRTGAVALAALVAFLVLVYGANAAGPPPPSAQAIGAAGLLTWLFVPWGAWIDRNREPRGPAADGAHTWPRAG
jgi:membrane-bound metal-dependent hydrolase YbcI (DUF457 family)